MDKNELKSLLETVYVALTEEAPPPPDIEPTLADPSHEPSLPPAPPGPGWWDRYWGTEHWGEALRYQEEMLGGNYEHYQEYLRILIYLMYHDADPWGRNAARNLYLSAQRALRVGGALGQVLRGTFGGLGVRPTSIPPNLEMN